MQDYTWPSIYFSYFFFAISLGVAVFFCVRSLKDGYWTRESEEIKFHVFEGEEFLTRRGPGGRPDAEFNAEKTRE